ncbi:MAG: nucleotidyltransferase domain-containing protein [Nitrososphaerales archaeon]
MTSKLDRLFGSKTRVTLLSKLMMKPDKQFYIRELSRELNIPYSMLYREVKNLVSLGILTEEKKGKVTLVSLNKKLSYFTELKGMMMKTSGLGDLMRSALSELKGIRYALIYGSFASGGEAESSDIGLLVVGNLSEEEVLKTVSQVEKEVGREINYILWSDKEFSNRIKSRHHLLIDIVRKPIIMLIGDEDEFRRIAKK